MAKGIVIALVGSMLSVALASPVLAQPGPDTVQPPGLTAKLPTPPDPRGTDRAMWGGGMAMFANYPMSMEDGGPMVFASKPLWLGNRYRFFQWAADMHALVGFGTNEKHAYVIAGPNFGFNLYLGSVFGFELREGIEGIAQIGERNVGGFMIGGMGAYVFRFWKDDRKRLKLQIHMHFGGYLASDPGNDMGMNAAMLGMGLGYEQPL